MKVSLRANNKANVHHETAESQSPQREGTAYVMTKEISSRLADSPSQEELLNRVPQTSQNLRTLDLSPKM